ncbi:hypothetical protein GCM10007989_00430 [Devosia pacifica]|uniref:THAP4-like heme-binding beta-barrel domain-containing protein n=1 Tax=Devosia pacifica TaxID=1335967 RepID=A0A918RTC6_9HYPH|nr:hypothetical protein [Devosia pacifica]GHA10235.1 hypothetical protein GCM10007989_00430 [Devosia pacifica]
MMKLLRRALTLSGLLAPMLVSPAFAGPAEYNLLVSYIGNWRGSGQLVGGDRPESFNCRMNIAKGNDTRINYAGRCALVGLNLSVSGTIAYNDANNRYEAAMSSNAGFTGLAIGQRQGDQISFDLREQGRDQSGNDVSIGSEIILKDGGITVNFLVEFNDSGDTMSASVPFNR